MAIPTTPEWNVLAFTEGLDISGWFDPLFEGSDWTAVPGGGWGVVYKREIGNKAIEVAPATVLNIFPTLLAPLAYSWRTRVTARLPSGVAGADVVFIVFGGGNTSGFGSALGLVKAAGSSTWNVYRETAAGYFLVASGVDLSPVPGSQASIELTFVAPANRITAKINGVTYGAEPPVAATPPHQQQIYFKDTLGATVFVDEWLISDGLTLPETTNLDREMGDQQGRMRPAGWTPPAGLYAYCLGFGRPGRTARICNGDSVEIRQTASFGDRTVVRVQARYRAPARPAVLPPVPNWWTFSVLVDGGERATRLIAPTVENTIRIRDMEDIEVCVADLAPGDHELTFKLSWNVAALLPPIEMELPAAYIDKIEMVTP